MLVSSHSGYCKNEVELIQILNGTLQNIMSAIKPKAHLSSDFLQRWIKNLLREKILHDRLHDGQDVSIITTSFTLLQPKAF